MPMNKKLCILFIVPPTFEMQQILGKLAQYGYEAQFWVAGDPIEIEKVLINQPIELIICDYDFPVPGNSSPLELMHAMNLDLPFLFLSHDINETVIIKTMQAGADDFICKSDLNRLVPAIEHNLREAQIRQSHRKAQTALQEHQGRLSAFISNLPGMAYQILLSADGHISFPYASEGSMALFGFSPQQLENDASIFLSMIHPDDRQRYDVTLRNSADNLGFWNWEGRITMPATGETKWINLRCTPQKLPNGDIQWEGVMFNITQSKSTEIELSRSQEELRALSLHIQDVREEERLNISREVHDNLGGMLTAIKLEVARMNNHLTAQDNKAADIAKGIEDLVDKCIAAASNISRVLRPSVLDCFGIVAAIEMEIDEFQKRTGIQCEFSEMDEGEKLDPELDIALFRIFQETLTNITKHAHASHIKVDIHNQAQKIALTVSDNGRGLHEADKHKPLSFGLRGIKERVMHLGGELDITSSPGKGTSVAVSIPRHTKIQVESPAPSHRPTRSNQ